MDLELTPDQKTLAEVSRGLLSRDCGFDRVVEVRGRAPSIDADLWRKVGEMGWPSLVLEPPLGPGMGLEEAVILFEEIGRVLAPIPLASTLTAAWLLARAPASDAVREVLAELAESRAVATIVTGSGRADDRAGPPIAAVGATLEGTAPLVRDAQVADWLVVQARAPSGIVLALVRADASNVTVTPRVTAGGLREASVTLAGVRLDDAVVVTADLGWGELEALQAFASLIEAAEVAGACARVVEMTTEHATERFQFGRAIGSFQAVRHRLADMLIELDRLRWAVRRAASGAEDGAPEPVVGSELQIVAAVASRAIVESGQQIHGGTGFFRDHPLHLYFGRQKAAELSGGLTREHRERIAAQLLDDEIQFAPSTVHGAGAIRELT